MEPATWGFIGTLVGTIVGASASIFATYLNSRANVNIQKNTEKFKRAELFREFQRDNLLKLQDEFSVGMRLFGKAYLETTDYFKKYGSLQDFRLSNEVDVSLNSMSQNLVKLTERVDNQIVREKIIDIRKEMSSVVVSAFEFENHDYLKNLSNKYEVLMTEIGIELRNNY